jgi:O-antigen/teichoic acid export membrane protein
VSEPVPTPAPPARRHLGWGALTVAGSQVAMLAAAMITSVVIARTEGARGTGEFALVYTLVDVTVMIAGLGFGQGITYAVSHRLWSLRVGFRIAMAATFALGAAGVVLACLTWLVGRDSFLEGMTASMALLAVTAVPFALAASFAATLALACDQYEVFSGIQVGQAILGAILIVALVLPFGMIGAVAGFAISYVMVGFAALWWAWRFTSHGHSRWHEAREGEAASVGSMVSFGLQAWSGNLLQYLNYRMDLFILNAYTTRADVGVYSLAVSLTALGWVLPNGLQAVLFPRTASVAASAASGGISQEEADGAIARASRHNVILMVPTALALVLLLVIVVPLLWGPEFADATLLGIVLLPGVLAIGFGKVLTAATTGRGYPKYALITVAIVTPITLAAYFVLVPPLGSMGAAISSTLSYGLTTILSYVYLHRVTGIPLRDLALPRRSDLADYRHAWGMVRELPAVKRFADRA